MQNFEPVTAEIVDSKRQAPSGDSCQTCGAPVDREDAFCGSCGQPRQPHSSQISHSTTSDGDDNRKYFQCNGCGSRVAVDASQRSYVCAFCDSSYVVEFTQDQASRHTTDFIIGFSVTAEEALEKFRQWVKSNSWFRPGDLKSAQIDDRLVGAYLPFWSFSMLAQSNWSANIGEYWYRQETYTTKDANGKTVTKTRRVRETEWWPLQGKHHQYYRGYLVSGSKGLSQKDADAIKPFQLPALKRYEPFYLAGWLCEEYSIEHDAALEVCQSVFLEREQANVRAFMPGDTHRSLDVQTWFSYIHADLCLLPVYVWSYRYRDKLYRFVVNGQTGKVTGRKPVSGTRVTIFVVCLIIVILLIVFGIVAANG